MDVWVHRATGLEQMKVHDARRLLAMAGETDEGPVDLPPSILAKLNIDDVPDGASFQIGTPEDGTVHLEWNGAFHRDGDSFYAEADHTWSRKYWYEPIGLEQYLDLVRRAVETRRRLKGDVELTHYDDDGAFISLQFRVATTERNLRAAYDEARQIEAQVLETVNQAADQVGKQIATIAARLSAWGSEELQELVEAVETATSADDKGRTLEELCSRLLSSIAGFTVTGRIRTETEEIDIFVLNGSEDPRLRREAAIILAECKNWMTKCGKNEFTLFRQKIENRYQRSSLGLLISWNGFADTVTKEMLRGSRDGILVVPIAGDAIRRAVREGDFSKVLFSCWDKAVST
jgi:hypothetical protein